MLHLLSSVMHLWLLLWEVSTLLRGVLLWGYGTVALSWPGVSIPICAWNNVLLMWYCTKCLFDSFILLKTLQRIFHMIHTVHIQFFSFLFLLAIEEARNLIKYNSSSCNFFFNGFPRALVAIFVDFADGGDVFEAWIKLSSESNYHQEVEVVCILSSSLPSFVAKVELF